MTTPADDIFASVRGPLEPRPFPLAPLFAHAEATSLRRLAFLLGLDGSTVSGVQHSGLTWRQADEWAIRLGKHPAEVWPDIWWSCIEPEEDET